MSQNPNTVKDSVQQTQQHLQSWTRGHTEEKHKQNHHRPNQLHRHHTHSSNPWGVVLSIGEEQIFKAWILFLNSH